MRVRDYMGGRSNQKGKVTIVPKVRVRERDTERGGRKMSGPSVGIKISVIQKRI